MQVDYIICGQGICGTFLSYYLWKQNKTFMVVDRPIHASASRVASGVVNPVTGRRIVKTWMIDSLLPFVQEAYQELGDVLAADLVQNVSVLDFHPTLQMQQAFEDRLQMGEAAYIQHCDKEAAWAEKFQFEYGIGEVTPALQIDLQKMLDGWREWLLIKNCLEENYLVESDLTITENTVRWKDYEAEKIIFCNGVDAADSQWFGALPFAPNKGEALIVEIKNLSQEFIYKQGISIVPWDAEKHLFWIGSTYKWAFSNLEPTEEFYQKATSALDKWLKLPYKVLEHKVSVRPANTQRRPFVGLHPQIPQIAILNGMGTKGCSIGPFFAHQLVQHLLFGDAIEAEGDVSRFADKLKAIT